MAVSSRTWFVAFSLLVHGGFAIGIGEIEIPKSHAATAIEIADVKKKAPPPEPAKVDPEPPKVERQARAVRKAAAEPEATPPPSAATNLDALPDFGLSLTGGVDGTGIALPSGGSTTGPRGALPSAPKKLSAVVPKAAGDECTETATKPKPKSVPQPAYTDAARTSEITGKVRVQLTVDETGHVVDVKLLQGLGYGLDEAALAAARLAEFEPAQRCGKPSRATFNLSMRFDLK